QAALLVKKRRKRGCLDDKRHAEGKQILIRLGSCPVSCAARVGLGWEYPADVNRPQIGELTLGRECEALDRILCFNKRPILPLLLLHPRLVPLPEWLS